MTINYGLLILITFITYLVIMWVSLFVWVRDDVQSRTNDKAFQYIAMMLVCLGNIFGVAIYLVIRPGQTFKEAYFSELEEKIILAQAKEFGVLDEKRLAKFTKKPRPRKTRLPLSRR